MSNTKKQRRQRAVITITEVDDHTIKAALEFNVSIKGKDGKDLSLCERLAMGAAQFIKMTLEEKRHRESGIILPDEAHLIVPGEREMKS